jgi:glyoxylase-like metal-dependent hydrolase (beta-lactamase superfamily II)
VLIIDPNWLPNEVDFIKSFVEKYYEGYKIYILFTHSDFDHIIGYGSFKSAKVIASRSFVTNPNKETILSQITSWDDEYYIRRSNPIEYPKVDIEISSDGQSLFIDGEEVVFYLAPGHVADGLMMVIPTKQCWIVGDYLSNIEIPFVDHDLKDYVTTLSKAEKILESKASIEIMIPGHGDVAMSRQVIQNRINNDQSYLQWLTVGNEAKVKTHLGQYYFESEMLKAHERNKMKV